MKQKIVYCQDEKIVDEEIDVPETIEGNGYNIQFTMEAVDCSCSCIPNKEDYKLMAYVTYNLDALIVADKAHRMFNFLDEIVQKVKQHGIINEHNIRIFWI